MLNRPRSFDDIPLVLTVEELMPVLGVGRNVVYELVRSGQIKSTHIGKHARILKPDLQRFLEGGGTGTNLSWTDAAISATLEGDSCRAAKGGNDDAAR